nr:pre-rRNA-processing protein TSR2-like [Malus domestica]
MEPERKLSAESRPILQEGIGLVLFRWSALQLAVENEWGSCRKAEQLVADIFSWFNHSTAKNQLHLQPLEIDGQFTVAEKLMIMYEECLDCNFKSIESLKEANQRKVAVPHVREVANDDDDDSDEDNDDGDHSMGNDDSSNMMVDIPEAHSNLNPVNVSGNEPTPKPAAEAEDGWEVVGARKHRGKRN